METKEYKVITEHDILGIGDKRIVGIANGGDESYTMELNDAQAKKILAQGAQLFIEDEQVTLADFADIPEPQAIDDGKCVDDYTNGDKNRANSRCKVVGQTRFFKPDTVEVPAANDEVTEDEEHTSGEAPGNGTPEGEGQDNTTGNEPSNSESGETA